MVNAMNTFQPHWSQTSARLMNACPRAWALTYGQPSHPSIRGRRAGGRPPKNLDEVMLRAMRSAWAKKTSDLYERKMWTTAYTTKVLTRLANDALAEHDIGAPMLLRRQKIERAVQQLRLLDDVRTLRPLVEGKPRRWAFFDRREPAQAGGMDLYAAPDLAVFHQNRWTLVRLQFRTPATNPLGQQLEHLLAVHWAMNQPGFPDDANAFRLNVVAWRGTRWREHHLEVSPQSLNQALALARHDVQEMSWLSRWASADPTLTSLPLASRSSHCDGCQHRRGCPAETGLATAKRLQENAQAKPSHREPTKSANTA